MVRLDITPVLIALRDRPFDFSLSEYTLIHTPSRHEFWISNGLLFYSLYRTGGCSCQRVAGGKFSFVQKICFYIAFRRWRQQWDLLYAKELNEQFALHFAPDHPIQTLIGNHPV